MQSSSAETSLPSTHITTPTVFSITHDCRVELQECVRLERIDPASHWAHNRLSGFNLWDAGVGASAYRQNSLDFRLQDDATAIKVVAGSLSTLLTWLQIYRKTYIYDFYSYNLTRAFSRS